MKSRWLVLGAVSGLLLTACAENSSEESPDDPGAASEPTVLVDTEPFRGLPPGVEDQLSASGTDDTSGGAGYADVDGYLWVVTYGSSSNPDLPVDVQAVDQTITLEISNIPDSVSTMDFVPTTSTVAIPDEVSLDEPIEVVFADRGVLTLDPTAEERFVWLPPLESQ